MGLIEMSSNPMSAAGAIRSQPCYMMKSDNGRILDASAKGKETYSYNDVQILYSGPRFNRRSNLVLTLVPRIRLSFLTEEEGPFYS